LIIASDGSPRSFFNFNCAVPDGCPVNITSFTLLGPAVQIYTPMYLFNAELRREEFGKPVEIRSDVWVGEGAIILPGVRIEAGAVIVAGSVVTRDVPRGRVCCGQCVSRDSRNRGVSAASALGHAQPVSSWTRAELLRRAPPVRVTADSTAALGSL
jgi:hypothetical protein